MMILKEDETSDIEMIELKDNDTNRKTNEETKEISSLIKVIISNFLKRIFNNFNLIKIYKRFMIVNWKMFLNLKIHLIS